MNPKSFALAMFSQISYFVDIFTKFFISQAKWTKRFPMVNSLKALQMVQELKPIGNLFA